MHRAALFGVLVGEGPRFTIRNKEDAIAQRAGGRILNREAGSVTLFRAGEGRNCQRVLSQPHLCANSFWPRR